ncbi:MAG: hypothetical protein K2P44_06745 [Lachnospiraceae bacterium]|nr:hypothetical protein [Lachnospiraceae bacterium]
MDEVAILAALGAYLVLVLVICVVCYVVSSLAHMKALKAMGYDKAWMAWIPFAQWYACADAATAGKQDNVTLFGSFSVPVSLYKFWWALWLVLQVLSQFLLGSILGLLATVVQIIFLGNSYVKMYAALDGTDEKDQQVIGYISGFLVIIAVFKFLFGNYKARK